MCACVRLDAAVIIGSSCGGVRDSAVRVSVFVRSSAAGNGGIALGQVVEQQHARGGCARNAGQVEGAYSLVSMLGWKIPAWSLI